MMYGVENMNVLVGRKVLAVRFPSDDTMEVDTDAGTMQWGLDADCCSESWFWHTEELQGMVGSKVVFVKELEMPAWNESIHGASRQDSDILYGYEIRTTKGAVTLEFRNSSNGYYGGSIEYRGCVPHGETV